MSENLLNDLSAPKTAEGESPNGILAAIRRFLFHEEAEEVDTIVWVVMITLVIALLTVQMEHYGAEGGQALDRAQQYAVQAIGVKARGETVAGYAWNDAYRQWLDWESQASLAEQRGEPEAAARYRVVRDRLATLTPLLSPAYLDASTGQPDLRAFESDTYLVEATVLQERYVRAMQLYDLLMTRSDTFGLQIVLLGIALALIAMAPSEELVPNRLLRRLPILTAVALTIFVVGWVVQIFLEPIPVYSDEAVDQYAQGVGLAYQGDHANALLAFDQALQNEPDYANVYYRRGNTNFALGNYAEAAADYQAAWDAGREEVNVLWNLGWTQYVLGDQPAAIATTQEALAMAEDQEALYFNLGLMHLAAGEVDAGRQAFDTGLEYAARRVDEAKTAGDQPPSSLWSYFTIALDDIDRLITCLESELCKTTPPYTTLAVDEAVRQVAAELRLTLKNAAVALEYTGALPGDAGTQEIGAFEFGTGEYDAAGNVTGFVALGEEAAPLRFGLAIEEESSRTIDESLMLATDTSAPVLVRFPYKSVQDGQLLVLKVYRNGTESPWLRLVENWSLGAAGEAVLPLAPSSQFALADGDYKLELYLDGHLLQEGAFQLGG
ncbi:MAG: tetratricopeptide repeat protein [Caldilinea sp.]